MLCWSPLGFYCLFSFGSNYVSLICLLLREETPLRADLSHNKSLGLDPSLTSKMGPVGFATKVRVKDKYKVVGFISSGTYGLVYKAVGKNGLAGEFAIKK